MTATTQNTVEDKSRILKDRIRGLGIRENSQDYHEYIRAKKVVEKLASSSREFDELIHVIVDFLKI